MDLVVAKTFVLFFCGSLVRHGEKIEEYFSQFVPFLADALLWPELSDDSETQGTYMQAYTTSG